MPSIWGHQKLIQALCRNFFPTDVSALPGGSFFVTSVKKIDSYRANLKPLKLAALSRYSVGWSYHCCMYKILTDLRVTEASSFVAAPSCAMHLASLGATVIRIDPIGGGLDYLRYPRARNGSSLYWEGLQKNKLSLN